MSLLLLRGSASHLPLASESVQCVVTSPPYWGTVRVYEGPQAVTEWGCALGDERAPADYIAHVVACFREVRRVLRPDGCAWLNVGDVFAASGKGGGGSRGARAGDTVGGWATVASRKGFRMPPAGYKMKDLTLVASQLADALRRDGWYMRQTVIWEKPAAVEPIRLDRPATSHEYVYLLAKSEHYAARDPGEEWWGRTVWRIAPALSSTHPGTMPEELARRCIKASTQPNDLVLDCFNGSGTTGRAAIALGRRYVGVDISDEYLKEQSRQRIDNIQHVMGGGLGV